MPITPFHLILNYIIYIVLVKYKVIKKGDYKPLWLMFAANLVDLDHFFRLFTGKAINEQVYGLNNLFFHGWWNVLPITLISMIKKYQWFALGWALHIFVDGVMIFFNFNYLLVPLN